MTSPAEIEAAPSNPFRHPRPDQETFAGLLSNLKVLEDRNRTDADVMDWCRRLRADIDEHLTPPDVVGVECGAPEAFDWPFRRHHRPHPGGVESEEMLDRFAYARKLGVREIYLLGGDVFLRDDLPGLLEAARGMGIDRITAETTASRLGNDQVAELVAAGLTGAVIEILAGDGHPEADHCARAAEGVQKLRRAGIQPGAKLVIGGAETEDIDRAWGLLDELELPLYTVVVLVPGVDTRIRDRIDESVTLVVE